MCLHLKGVGKGAKEGGQFLIDSLSTRSRKCSLEYKQSGAKQAARDILSDQGVLISIKAVINQGVSKTTGCVPFIFPGWLGRENLEYFCRVQSWKYM